MDWSLAVAALLNWQWSQTRGPQTAVEKMMLWTLIVGGATSGYRYFQVGAYKPAFGLSITPLCSVVGMLMT